MMPMRSLSSFGVNWCDQSESLKLNLMAPKIELSTYYTSTTSHSWLLQLTLSCKRNGALVVAMNRVGYVMYSSDVVHCPSFQPRLPCRRGSNTFHEKNIKKATPNFSRYQLRSSSLEIWTYINQQSYWNHIPIIVNKTPPQNMSWWLVYAVRASVPRDKPSEVGQSSFDNNSLHSVTIWSTVSEFG